MTPPETKNLSASICTGTILAYNYLNVPIIDAKDGSPVADFPKRQDQGVLK